MRPNRSLAQRVNDTSLGIKLLVPGLIALAIFVAALTFFWNGRLATALQTGADDKVNAAVIFMSTPVADAVWNFDDQLAQTALQPFVDLSGAVFARVYADGNLFVEVNASDYQSQDWQQTVASLLEMDAGAKKEINGVTYISKKLFIDDKVIGDLILAFDMRASHQVLSDGRAIAAILGVTAFACFAVVLYANTLQVTRPLKRLLKNLSDLRSGDIDVNVTEAVRGDEIGELAVAVEKLRDSERERRTVESRERLAHEEQQKVVVGLSEALSKLADGNLTVTLDSAFPSAYEDLRSNFNLSTGALRKAMLEIFDVADEIAGGAREVNAASEQLAKQAEGQAVNAEEACTALELVTEAMNDVTKICGNAAKEATKSQEDVQANRAVVKDTIDAMSDIRSATEEIVATASKIEDIAFQTNLLALNAGVEAARAGEVGRGFAIVASEVRNLANGTSEMAGEIARLIQQSKEAVDKGVDLVERAGGSMETVGERVISMSGLIDEVVASVQEQTKGIAELNSVVGQVDNMSQSNAALAEETLAASHVMKAVGQNLVACITNFEIEGDAKAPEARLAS